MIRIYTIFLVLFLSACALSDKSAVNQEFADQRFYSKLLIPNNNGVYFVRPHTIAYKDIRGENHTYLDCHMLENKMSFIKIECQKYKKPFRLRDFYHYTIDEYHYYKKLYEQGVPDRRLFTFAMDDERNEIFGGYLVLQTEYVWDDNLQNWKYVHSQMLTTPIFDKWLKR